MTFQRGFTLVEVLVATVILFFSVATLTGIINSANLNTLKVNERLVFYSQMQSIAADIKLQLLTQPDFTTTSGQGATANLRYQWTAEPTMQKPSLGDGGEDFTSAVQGMTTIGLYQVTVSVIEGTRQSNYSYSVLAWKDESNSID